MSRKSLSALGAQSAVPRSAISALRLPTRARLSPSTTLSVQSKSAAGRCVAFLSEYHSCTCFLSKKKKRPDEKERGGITVELFWDVVHSLKSSGSDISNAQANVKLWVTDINKMVNPGLAALFELDCSARSENQDL